MNVDGVELTIAKWWVHDVLEKRIEQMHLKLEDLFMVVHAPTGYEGMDFIETRYGRLRIFFSNACPRHEKHILHKKKYDYPRVNNSIILPRVKFVDESKPYDKNGDLKETVH